MPAGGVLDVVVAAGFGGRVLETGVALLEGVRDVLEEHEPERDVLVLGGLQVPAHLVGGVPQDRLKWALDRRLDLASLGGWLGFGHPSSIRVRAMGREAAPSRRGELSLSGVAGQSSSDRGPTTMGEVHSSPCECGDDA